MDRFLLLIACAFGGNSCLFLCFNYAPCGSEACLRIAFRRPTIYAIPPSATRAAGVVHHRMLHATHHHRHALRRTTVARHHRLLNPWNDLPLSHKAPASIPTLPKTNLRALSAERDQQMNPSLESISSTGGGEK